MSGFILDQAQRLLGTRSPFPGTFPDSSSELLFPCLTEGRAMKGSEVGPAESLYSDNMSISRRAWGWEFRNSAEVWPPSLTFAHLLAGRPGQSARNMAGPGFSLWRCCKRTCRGLPAPEVGKPELSG